MYHPFQRSSVAPLLFVAAILFSGCGLLGEDEETGLVLSTDSLVGRTLLFDSNVNTGGEDKWEYTFVSPGVVWGCNQHTAYQATDWIPNDNKITVYFGGQYEEYTFENHVGDLSKGSMVADFSLTTSAGTSGSGRVFMTGGTTLPGCNQIP